MIKYIIHLSVALLSLLTCAGCHKEDANVSTSAQPKTIMLRLSMSEMTQFTRAINESEIQDINLYIYYLIGDERDPALEHKYITTPELTIPVELRGSEFRAVAIANYHSDLGDLSYDEIKALSASLPSQTDGMLPMYAEVELDLSHVRLNDPVSLTFPLKFYRTHAKINYNITLTPTASDILITGVEFCSIPHSTKYVGGNVTPSSTPSDYFDQRVYDTPTGSSDPISGTFYMADNPQGEVPSITKQQLKNKSNAPSHASHLIIHATKGAKTILFYIYLGQNNTTDFNVLRNQEHTLNIRILNDSEVDTRITTYTLRLTDGWTEEWNTADETTLDVEAVGQNLHGQILEFTGNLQVLEGAAGFEVNRDPVRDLFLGNYIRNGSYWYVNYNTDLELFTASNNRLIYEVSLVRDGVQYDAHFEHKFANWVSAIAPDAVGELEVSGALRAITHSSSSVGGACLEEGCTFTARAKDGYAFVGWYGDHGHTQLLSTSATYTHHPRSASETISTKWQLTSAPTVSINCAQSNKNSTYMFNANTVSLTSTDYTGPLNVTVAGVTGGIMATAVNYTLSISAGQTLPVGVLNFVPRQVGEVAYTIHVTTPEGISIASKTITNTAVATTLVPTIQIEYGGEYFISGYELYGERADWGGYNDISIRVAFSPVLDYPVSLGSREMLHVKFTPQIDAREVEVTWVANPDDPYGPEYEVPGWKYLPTPSGCEFNEVDVTYAASLSDSPYYLLKGKNELPGNNEIATPSVFQPHTFGRDFLQIPSYGADAHSMYGRLMVTYTLKDLADRNEIILTNKLIKLPLNIETDVKRITYINRLN